MSDTKKPAILLVDDDDVMLQYLGRAIKRSGYELYTASDGIDGIVAFSNAGEHIHLVVSDIVMPKMDGIEFCQRISATARHIYEFVFMTGFSPLALKSSQSNPGSRIINKPFHVRDFISEIDKAMVRVVHKRKRLLENATSNMNAKLDHLIEKVEWKIQRERQASLRAERQTIVLGSGNNISITNDNRSVEIVNNIVPGDFATLSNALAEIGVSRRYVTELQTAIAQDEANASEEKMGENSERWLKRTLRSVGKGTTKVAGDVATAMLTKIVATYFGYPS